LDPREAAKTPAVIRAPVLLLVNFAFEALKDIEYMGKSGFGCGLSRQNRAFAASTQQQNR
jgi:hypothetical protein